MNTTEPGNKVDRRRTEVRHCVDFNCDAYSIKAKLEMPYVPSSTLIQHDRRSKTYSTIFIAAIAHGVFDLS